MVKLTSLISGFLALLVMLFCLVLFVTGCAPKNIEPIRIPQIEVEESELFIPEDRIEKPEKPNPLPLDTEFSESATSRDIAYFAFKPVEFAKIVQLSKAFDAQGRVIDNYVEIINAEMEVSNSLKRLVSGKNMVAQHFADLYINEQNMRLQEEYERKKEKIFDKILLYLQSGVIIVLSVI